MVISRDAFFDKFAAAKDAYKDIKVHGETVRIKRWTGVDRGLFEAACRKQKESEQFVHARSVAVVYGVIDEAGNRIFSDEDVPHLSETIGGDVLDKIYDSLSKYNRLSAKDVEDLEKN